MSKILLVLLLSLSFIINSCQSPEKKLSKSQRIEIFEKVWNIVNEHFYDPNFNGIDWEKKNIEYKTQIENCNNSDTLFLILNKMLFELNSSHCGVGLLSELDKVVSPYIFSNGEIGLDVRIIENQIVITNVLKNSSADIANIKTGYIIEKIDDLTIKDFESLTKYKPPFNDRNKKFHLTSEILRHIYGQSGTKVKIVFLDENSKSHTESLTRTKG